MKKIHLLIFILPVITLFTSSFICAQSLPEKPAQIEVLFSPKDNCAQEIVSAIDNAKSYVYVAMYYFTSRPLAQAVIRAKDRDVEVRICLAGGKDPAYDKYSKSRYLIKNDVDVKVIEDSGIMHNKFCIIDDFITITGSYNWTVSADLENDENVLIINSEKIARIYKKQFEKFWNGTYINSCKYKDKDRLEKVPVATGVSLPVSADKGVSKGKYVASKNSNKFHKPNCKWAQRIKPENEVWFDSRKDATDKGYIACKVCRP